MTKVLLVEDDNNLREIYEARLAAEGYDIATASDGEDALAVAKQQKPDLIISDVMMPRISGFEMLDILRNTDGLKHVKIIMLTALGQSEDKSRADSLGADRYLVKSQVTLEDIVKTAAELLDPDAATHVDTSAAAAPAPQAPVTPVTQDVAVATPPPAEPVVASEPSASPAPDPRPIIPPMDIPAPTTDTTQVAAEPVTPSPAPQAPVTPVTQDVAVATPPPAEPVVASEPSVVAPVAPVMPEPVAPTSEVTPAVTPITVTDGSSTVSDTPQTETAAAPEATQASLDPEVAAVTASVQSSLEESKTMEKQINDFVNQEQPAPETTTTPVASEPAETPASAPELNVPAAESTHESLISDAATGLNLETVEVEPEKEAESTSATEPKGTDIQIPGKKVIQPPTESSDKPDLDALLALEEAKEQQETGIVGDAVVGGSEQVTSTPVADTPPAPAEQTPATEEPAPTPPSSNSAFTPNANGQTDDEAL
jgi:CheY-like chemotaxis protein